MNREIDYTAKCFSAALIVLVVANHLAGFKGLLGLFPPYSFHVAGFAFVSGYLYRSKSDASPIEFLLRRVRRLLLPGLAMYGLYGTLQTFLVRAFGFGGTQINLENWLFGFFTYGHSFVLSDPMWFIGPFCLAQVAHNLLRAAIARMGASPRLTDVVSVAVCCAGGVWAVAQGGGVPDNALPGGTVDWALAVPYLLRRLLYFLAWLSLGRAYRKWLERHDVVRGSVYFPVLVALQLLLLYACNGSVTYQLAWGYYPNGVVLTFLCTATGIAMLLRVCRYVSPFVSRGERGLVRLIGDNTFSIMCHHYMGVFVIDALVFIASRLTPLFGSFDVAVWRKTTKYVYLPHGIEQFEVFYIAFAIVFSIAVHFGWVRLKMAVGSLVNA